jgi:SAM-dependent methyltransferase
VSLIPAFSRLGRVTSDCKPWKSGGRLGRCNVCGTVQKPVDAAWAEESRRIYEDYSIYHQGGGKEPALYVGGFERLVERSVQLFRSALAEVPLKPRGRLLDVGCGNGAALRTVGPLLLQWTLEGNEIDDKYRAEVEAIPGVARLHVGPLPEGVRYDLITLVHVLEHVAQPARFLAQIANLLEPDGVLLVVLPDVRTNSFDILVADHCSHFSTTTLEGMLRRGGFADVRINDTWMSRQLTALARPGNGALLATNNDRNVAPEDIVAWLTELRNDAGTHTAGSFGIFGSSINAVWLAGELGSQVSFFVDEDSSRVGQSLLGRPILAPDAIPANATVYVAMPFPWCEDIAKRLSRHDGPSYRVPPRKGCCGLQAAVTP